MPITNYRQLSAPGPRIGYVYCGHPRCLVEIPEESKGDACEICGAKLCDHHQIKFDGYKVCPACEPGEREFQAAEAAFDAHAAQLLEREERA